MNKIYREVKSDDISFYSVYLSSFPNLSKKEIVVLSELFDLRYNNLEFKGITRRSICMKIKMSYNNVASVINNMKHKGIIKGFIDNKIVSPLYIPKGTTSIHQHIVYEDSRV
jgi:hypothetical protein